MTRDAEALDAKLAEPETLPVALRDRRETAKPAREGEPRRETGRRTKADATEPAAGAAVPWHALHAAVCDSALPTAEKALLWALLRDRSKETGEAFASVPRLAAAAGLTDRGARKAIRRLERRGAIRLVEASVGGRGRVNRWAFDVLGIVQGLPETPHPVRGSVGETRNHVPRFQDETRNHETVNPEPRSAVPHPIGDAPRAADAAASVAMPIRTRRPMAGEIATLRQAAAVSAGGAA